VQHFRRVIVPDIRCQIAVIGGGIVGLAVALELQRKHPHLRTVVLEKEHGVAQHQTSHNSGVIHSGLYYKPGSLKARLCVEGTAAMVQFCKEQGIPYSICGKVIVATDEPELPALDELMQRGRANGVPGLRLLGAEEIRELEPHAAGIRGIHAPGTGITDFRLVAEKYAELINSSGGEVLTNAAVEKITSTADEIILDTARATVRARYAINCAGLFSDRIAKMAGAELGLRIIPFRGEYYELVPSKHHLVRALIYPVPDVRFPFLGVHFTKRIDGGTEAGPNAVLAFKREGYSRTSFNLRDAAGTFAFPGFWKLATHFWKMGLYETFRSWNKRAFTKALQRLLPELEERDIRPSGSGVRAQALDASGKLLDDFCFVHQDRMLHVCNVPSPAATASLVIGREIVAAVEQVGAIPANLARKGEQ
jgi:L-2-hydroxyglutarate oxidase LhgO